MTHLENNVAWPPPYQLKKHRRARHVKMRVCAEKGLLITIPHRFSPKHLPDIFEKNKDWILKHLANTPRKKEIVLPTQISLQAIQQTYSVFYVATDKKLSLLERPNQELIILGKIDDKVACKKILVKWVKSKAALHLPMQLEKISQQIYLPFTQASVRNQRTLWGSCTRDKNISLNYKLIFLPPHLMNHIFIHELCHTKHMNHSEKFWHLVANFDADWRANKKTMRQADAFIPEWVL